MLDNEGQTIPLATFKNLQGILSSPMAFLFYLFIYLFIYLVTHKTLYNEQKLLIKL